MSTEMERVVEVRKEDFGRVERRRPDSNVKEAIILW
jgi:hypothetical protein